MRLGEIETVVVPVDFSDESFAAVEMAAGLVPGSVTLHVIHVLPDLIAGEAGYTWDVLNNETRCEEADKALKEKFRDPKYGQPKVKVVIGDPGHGIVEHAGEVGADLIMIPSHGRTGIKRLLIGSVAERVVRLAHCPVLVLRD